MLAQLSGWLENDPAVARLRAALAKESACGGTPCAREKELRP
jgi:hypothetical protein